MDPRHLQSVARRYPYLRGLQAVPTGAMLVALALFFAQWGPFANVLLPLAVVLAHGPLFRWIGRWYDERYGRVTPVHHERARTVGLALAIALVVAVAVAIVLVLVTSTSLWPALPDLGVNAAPLVLGLVALAAGAVRPGLRPHNVAVWGSVVALAALPIWHGRMATHSGGLILVGVAMMLNGVLDHLALVRLLGPPAGDPESARG